MNDNNVKNYGWKSTKGPHSCDYITPAIIDILEKENPDRVIDIGCGNGQLCKSISDSLDSDIVGVDNDNEGIEIAKKAYPNLRFYKFGVQDDPDELINSQNGQLFDLAVTTEVIEHLYSPHLLLDYAYKVLKPNGKIVITTPYHGYWKNLALSIFDKWDDHHTPLWEGGHIKFWSIKTISKLLATNGFKLINYSGVGRIKYLWKSMVVIAEKINTTK